MSLIRVILPVVLVGGMFASVAEARLTRASKQEAPATAAPASPAPAAVAVASCAPAKCCPPSICYRSHKGCGCFDPCKRMDMVLMVKDPCSCCLVEVPVCIPACCTGNPIVCCHKGFLHRNVVEYSWPCGFCLKVVFDRRGDVTVHYYG
jgi:hypothetical protein